MREFKIFRSFLFLFLFLPVLVIGVSTEHNKCQDTGITDFSYYSLNNTHYKANLNCNQNWNIDCDNSWKNKYEDGRIVDKKIKIPGQIAPIPVPQIINFTNEEKNNIITHLLFHPKNNDTISIDKDNRIPLIVIHGLDIDHDINPLYKADKDNLCSSVKKHKEYLYVENMDNGYTFDVLNNFLSSNIIRDKYRVYYYSYPSYKHISYNGRLLSNLLYEDEYIRNWIKNNKKITFIAHSMGGLVARSMLEGDKGIGYEDDKNNWNNIPSKDFLGKLITLATPHHGSPTVSNAWFDTPDWISKNRNNPGSQDLAWDNYDNIYINNSILNDVFDLGIDKIKDGSIIECTSTQKYVNFNSTPWYDNEKRYIFMEKFDKYFSQDNQNIKICYNYRIPPNYNIEATGKVTFPKYPNPWLASLNNKLTKGENIYLKDRYYFYGGINDTDNSHPTNIINDDKLVYGLATDALYIAKYFNDLVVPISSSFLDEIPIDYSSFLKDSSKLLLMKDTSPKIRFFKDYHHHRIHSGAYRESPSDIYDITKASGFKDENKRKAYIKQSFESKKDKYIDDNYESIKLNKITFDPLYIRLALDLDIDIDYIGSVFSDISTEDPSYEAIKYLKDNKIVNGYKDGTYKPYKKLNRAEFLAFVVKAKYGGNLENMTEKEQLTAYKTKQRLIRDNFFSDVKKEDWYLKYLSIAQNIKVNLHGYISTDGKREFRANNLINFAEASKMILRTFLNEIDNNELYKIEIEQIKQYKNYIYSCKQSGEEECETRALTLFPWWKPYLNKIETDYDIQFEPQYGITRADMAYIIAKVKGWI